MAETYRISAVPTLHREGEHQGQLSSVTFAAVSSTDSRQWSAKNCGQFEKAFGKLMHRTLARLIVESLMQGDAVEFPGAYQEHQFDQGFLYEWSPVYLVLPPIFFTDKSRTGFPNERSV